MDQSKQKMTVGNSHRLCFKKLLPHLQSVASFLPSAHRRTKMLDFDDFKLRREAD